ncbi:MAG TPA: hypothetical protein VEC57_07185 [Candidatus Limnocylindrales bacterium]|nr:hypothetical protein [Candidatus Limnocylindrales bacterium]
MISAFTARNPRIAALAGLAAALALILTTLPARAGGNCPGYQTIFFCGELTGDCNVSASDGLLALKMGVGQVEEVPEADLSLDGQVTAVDALAVLRVAVGSLPPTLSCSNQRGFAATSVGFYNAAGTRSSNGYAVGWYAGVNGSELRNYLVFDLSSLDGYITSGLLHLSTAPDVQAPYNSADPSETYTLFAIATPIATLTGAGGLAAFADLGDGTVYGTLVADSSLAHVVDIAINGMGLDYLRQSDGLVALGGAITTLAKGQTGEYIFNSTGVTNVRSLVVYVE